MPFKPAKDSAFRTDDWVGFNAVTASADDIIKGEFWVSGDSDGKTDPVTGEPIQTLNMEILFDGGRINAYFHPDDLERLGILLTYTARRLKGELD